MSGEWVDKAVADVARPGRRMPADGVWKKLYAVWLDPAQVEELDRAMGTAGVRTRSAMIRRLIAEGLAALAEGQTDAK